MRAVLQSPCPSVRSHYRNRYLSFYWKKWFYIWYMALAWWLVPCLPLPGLPHIYFLFTLRLRIFHVCRNENFRNSYLSFYWKKWCYIWYMALAWWLVPCLPFPGLPHIYFLFTVRLTNEWVGVFLARCSVQHLVWLSNISILSVPDKVIPETCCAQSIWYLHFDCIRNYSLTWHHHIMLVLILGTMSRCVPRGVQWKV